MIVIPTYNEAENIKELVNKIRSVLPTERILFVDDSSPDGTAEIIKPLQATDKYIELIVRTAKKGFAASYIEGFKKALSNPETKYVITMDADMSHPAEKILEMINALNDNQVVIGSRYATGGSTPHWNIFRMFLSKLGNFYARTLSGLKVKDMTSGFMAIPIASLRKLDLNSFHTEGYAFLMDLKQKLALAGTSFKELPIEFSERPHGTSKFSLSILTEGIVFPLKMLVARLLKTTFENKISWLVFAASFVVYYITAPRTITFGDNAEFITAVDTLGIPHPSGYPLYILLAKAFSILPFGDIVLRVNLFSAFCASISLVLACFLLLKCLKYIAEYFEFNRSIRAEALATALATLGFGFTHIFWYQAIVAKIYPLNLLITLVLVHLLIKFFETKNVKWIYLGALTFGLGFSNHQSIILFAPLFFLLLLVKAEYRVVFFKAKTISLSILLFVLGSLPYLYLPIASSAYPQLDWGSTSESISNVINHIKRSQYSDVGGSFNISDKISYLSDFGLNIFTQLGLFLIFLLPGLYALIKSGKRLLALFLGIIFFNGLGIILIRSLPYTPEAAEYYATYYLPAYIFAYVLVFLGIYFSAHLFQKYAKYILLSLAVIFLVFNFSQNYTHLNFSKFEFVEQYSTSILKSLSPNSVLVFSVNDPAEDSYLFSLIYQQYVKQLRPDVQVVAHPDIFKQADEKAMHAIYAEQNISKQNEMLLDYAFEQYPNREIYTTYILTTGKYQVRSNGFAYKVFTKANAPRIGLSEPLEISNNDETILTHDYFARELLKQYYLSQATTMLQQGKKEEAHALFVKAINLASYPLEQQQNEYAKFRDFIKGKENI